jgi:hypothetical protein
MADTVKPEAGDQASRSEAGEHGDRSALTAAGAALSRPGDAAVLKSKLADQEVPPGFSAGHSLLAGLSAAKGSEKGPETAAKGAETADKGPEFPIKVPYNAEAAYQVDGKPTRRGEELQSQALDLVKGAAKSDGSLSLKDHGKIMDHIARDKSLSEADKWYVYKQVCKLEAGGRDHEGLLVPGTRNYRVLFDAARPTGLPESGKGDVVRHIIIDPTNDSYHGGLVYGSSSWRAGFMRGENGIYFHEEIEKPLVNMLRGEGFGVNRGDEAASQRQLKALRAMQQGGFGAYSRSWNEGFAQ